MRYIQREVHEIRLPHLDERGQHVTLTIDTGLKLYEAMATKTDDLTSIEQSVLADFYKKIDPRYTGDCQIPEGDWIELTDPQHDLLIKRLDAKIRWFGNIDHPIVFRIQKDWRDAPTKCPKSLKIAEPSEPSENGKVEPEAVGVV